MEGKVPEEDPIEGKENLGDIVPFDETKKKKKKKPANLESLGESSNSVTEKMENLAVADGIDNAFVGLKKKKKKQVEVDALNEEADHVDELDGNAGNHGEKSVAENMKGFIRGLSTPLQRKEKGKRRGLDDLNEKKGFGENATKKRRCRPKVADDKFSLKPKKAKVKISKPVKVKRKYEQKKKYQPVAAVRPPDGVCPQSAEEGKLNDTEGREALISYDSLFDSGKVEELKGTCRRPLVFNDENAMFTATFLNPDNEMGLRISSLLLKDNEVQDAFSCEPPKAAVEPTSAEEKFSDNETSKAVEPPFLEEEKLRNSEVGEDCLSGDRLLNLDEVTDSRGLCREILDSQELNAISTVDISKADTEMELEASESLLLDSDSRKKDTSTLLVYVRNKKRQVLYPEPPYSEEVKVKPNEPSGGTFCSGTLPTSAREEYNRGSSMKALDLEVENAMSSEVMSQTNKKRACTLSSSILKKKDSLDLLYNPLVAQGRMMRNCQCIQLMRKRKPNMLKMRKNSRMIRKRRVEIYVLFSSFHAPKLVSSSKTILQYQEWNIPTRKQRSKGVTKRREFSPLLTAPLFSKLADGPTEKECSVDIEQECRVEISKTNVWPTHDDNLVTVSKGAALPCEEHAYVGRQEFDLNEEPQSVGFDLNSAPEQRIDYSTMAALNLQPEHVNHHSLVPWTNEQVPVHNHVYMMGSCYPSQISLSLQKDAFIGTGSSFHIAYHPTLWDAMYDNIHMVTPLRFHDTNEQEPIPVARGGFCTFNDPNDHKLYYNNPSLFPHVEQGSTAFVDNCSVNAHLLVPYCEPSTLSHGQELVTRVDTSLDIVSDISNHELVISTKRKKVRTRVKFDSRTIPMFKALMGDNSYHQCNEDEESNKWWRQERRVFEEKVHAFISYMHKIQGNRRFSRWKGSVLDSVMGVYLTQNVSDHLSSSAYMCLAAKYPAKPSHTKKAAQEEMEYVVGASQESTGSNDPVLVPTSELSDQEILNERIMDDEQIAQFQNSLRIESRNEFAENIQTENEHAIPAVGLKGFEEWLSLHEQVTQPQDLSHLDSENKECLSPQEMTNLPRDSSLPNPEAVECTSQEQTTHSLDSSCPNSVTEELLFHQHEQKTHPQDCSHPKSETEELLSNQMEQMTTRPKDSSHPNSGNQKKIPLPKVKKNKTPEIDWLKTKRQYCNENRERNKDNMDSVDWEAVRKAPVEELAEAIKKRGQHNILAASMQEALNRIYSEIGSLDLEWLRDTPPGIAKDILESIRGIGLKSVECIRLLALEQVAFPVDVNVGRVAVRLGWVDLKDVPPGTQFHLIEKYPVMDAIQQYLWPRLCELDQPTLYELHYQMITFGKIFCKQRSPCCNACPLRAGCKYFASAYVSEQLSITDGSDSGVSQSLPLIGDNSTQLQTFNDVTVKMLDSPESYTEMPASQELHMTLGQPHVEEATSPESKYEVLIEDIEDLCKEDLYKDDQYEDDLYKDDPDIDDPEIPHIILNNEEFRANVNKYLDDKRLQMGAETSNALVVSAAQDARIPVRKLKDIKDLRTEHFVYEIPDSHPLLRLHGLDERDPDDPCFYLLAIWSPDESVTLSMQPNSNCGTDEETCSSSCSCRHHDENSVPGTFMIPCRTAMKGRFPLNGTYFQVNEVFADDESSHRPVKVPRSYLWDLDRRVVYCGSSISSITTGMTTKEIQLCFWREYICVRGINKTTGEPKVLAQRLHKLKTSAATQTKRPSVPKQRKSKKTKIQEQIQEQQIL